jgi:hypothetical protein
MGSIAEHAVPAADGGVTMTGQQIYENFQSGDGAGWLHEASDGFRAMMDEYDDLGNEIMAIMKGMEWAWQGEAGDAARHGAGPMAVEFAGAQMHMNQAQDLIGKQGGLFDTTKHNVVPVPQPDPPSGWGILKEVVVHGVTGGDTGGFQSYQDGMAAHSDAAKHNADQMRMYSADSTYNQVNLPNSYGRMLASESAVHVDHGGDGTTGGGGAGAIGGGWNHLMSDPDDFWFGGMPPVCPDVIE